MSEVVDRKRATKRTTAPEWTERDQEWAATAKVWMEAQTNDFFDNAVKQPNYYTAADVLGWIDTRQDLPTAYVRFLSDYDTRYNWTNALLERLGRAGELEVGTTINARNREARCYRRPRAQDYDIQVEGPHAERIRTAITQWLALNPELGLDSLLITRGKQHNTIPEPAADGSDAPEPATNPRRRGRGHKSSFKVEHLRSIPTNDRG